MSTLEVSPADSLPGQPSHSVINDFSIQVATVNGSGSQTANTVLMRAIFQMGIPVSGKNMFPSNIAGTAHLVHHPRQQARVHRPPQGNRFPGGHEPGNRARRRHEAGQRRRRGLRRAAEAQRTAQRPALLPRPVRQAGGAGVPRSQAAQAGPQHDLRRRGRQAARHRNGRDPQGAVQAVRQAEGQGRRTELGRLPGRLRLRRQDLHRDRSASRRADERDRRQDHHRWQRRLRAGLPCSPAAPWSPGIRSRLRRRWSKR